jgi:hypothetical protein
MAMALRVVQSMPFEAVKVYVDPPLLADYLLVPGKSINVSVNVDNIPANPGLAGAQFIFSYDPTLLSVGGFEEVMFHNVTPPSEWDNIWAIKHQINNTAGRLEYAYTWQEITQWQSSRSQL